MLSFLRLNNIYWVDPWKRIKVKKSRSKNSTRTGFWMEQQQQQQQTPTTTTKMILGKNIHCFRL
jgi:hypothetical protein